jgi:hypothetical protein
MAKKSDNHACDAFKVLLLTVEDHFLIEGRGLVVVPLLDIPPDDRLFKPFSDEVVICRPDGTEVCFAVTFVVEHFSLVGGGGKCNIVAMLPKGTKETVPVGSRIFVTEKAHARIRGEDPNEASDE